MRPPLTHDIQDPHVREALAALSATFSRMDMRLKAVIPTRRVPVVGRIENHEVNNGT